MACEQEDLRNTVRELVTKTLANNTITLPTSLKWSAVFRLVSDAHRLTDMEQLPFYLSHEEAVVREAAGLRLRELLCKG